MATDERPPTGALVARLLARPQGFNLFQAISLLERSCPESAAVGTGNADEEAVRLSSVVSLGFQPSDISKISLEQSGAQGYKLSTPVMSLAGGQGPLPLPFTEMVLERNAARDTATADFLDIFNHRFLSFLYRSRKKHHMGLQWRSPQSSTLAACLDSLSSLGLHSASTADQEDATWLRHAGLMGGAPRSMSGLLVMISDRLNVRATGRQFCGAWRMLEQRDIPILSTRHPQSAPRLGATAVLGNRVWDQSAGVRITLSQLSVARFRSLLKGGKDYLLLKAMVLRYLQQDISVEVELQLDKKEVLPTVLGQKEPLRLGLTSWLMGSAPRNVSIPPACYTIEAHAIAGN
jgi:type VI secretion system protein ImpH